MNNKIALDVGFGFTKLKTSTQQLTFPSAVAKVKASMADFEQSNALNFEGANYLVGDAAVRDAIITRDFSFLYKYTPLILYYALWVANVNTNETIYLSTGLSMMNWKRKDEFTARISDFIINNTRINNININLTPQGKGAYLEFIDKNPEFKNKLIMVVDIGTYTLDVIIFENGKALVSESFANSFGTNKVITELQKQINKDYSASLNEAEINNLLQTKQLRIEGDVKDLSILVNDELDHYYDLVSNQITGHNSELFNRADAILVTGGGAKLLQHLIPQNKHYVIMQDSQNANVNGYWSLLS